MGHFFRKRKWLYVVLPLIALILVLRFTLPPFFLNQTNNYLGTFSPLYAIHVREANINLWRLAYGGNDVRGVLKNDAFEFLVIKNVDISLAWRELFRGRFVVDIDVTNAEVKLTTASIRAMSGYGLERAKEDAQDIKDRTIPFDLERVRVRNGSVLFADMPGLPPEQSFYLSKANLIGGNLTPQKEEELSLFTLTGVVQNSSALKLVAQVRSKKDPADWNMNVEMRNFELKQINPIARRTIPMTFTKGRLSVYSAVRKQNGYTEGYVKPFLKDVEIVGNKNDFKNTQQFFFEIFGTVGNFILKNKKTKTLATKVNFKTEKGKLKVDTGKAINLVLKNALEDPIAPKLDETLDLK